jgi:hypothetical protein
MPYAAANLAPRRSASRSSHLPAATARAMHTITVEPIHQ